MINSVLMMSEYYVLRQFTFLGVPAQHSHLKDCYMIDIIFLVFLNVNIILIVDKQSTNIFCKPNYTTIEKKQCEGGGGGVVL